MGLIAQELQSRYNIDGAESVFIERQLESVRSRVLEVMYADLLVRQLVPVNNEDDPGAETIRQDVYDSFGVAKIVASYAKDFPRADIKTFESRAVVKSLGDSYGYNIQEARAAAFANRPLEQRKANAAVKAMAQLLERIGLLGDVPNNLTGLFNIPGAQIYATPNSATSGLPQWVNKTADEILKDMNAMWRSVVQNTKNVERPDTLALPITKWGIISTTPRSATTDTTILKFFLANNPDVKAVVPVYRLTGQGVNGSDRGICYKRDPDVLQLAIPQEFEQFPPQYEGMELSVPCHMRTAGVLCFRPQAVIYADNI
jgi:hypothetical protein